MPTTVYHLPRARCTSIYFVAMLFVNAVDCRRHLSSSLSVSTQQSFLLNFDNRLVSEFASFDRCNIQTFQKLVAARSTQINRILAIFLIYRMSSRYPPSSTHFHGLPYFLKVLVEEAISSTASYITANFLTYFKILASQHRYSAPFPASYTPFGRVVL